MAKTQAREERDKTKNPVVLGQQYRDKITGFQGIATARVEYLYGCVRIELEGHVSDLGDAKVVVVDEQRLTEVPSATSGGARPSIPARGVPGR